MAEAGRTRSRRGAARSRRRRSAPAAGGRGEPTREVAPRRAAPDRDRLGRARSLFAGYLTSVRSRDRIDESTWEELEEALILATSAPA